MPSTIRPFRPTQRLLHIIPGNSVKEHLAPLRQRNLKAAIAPKVTIDIKHIRQNEELYKQNAIERNYELQSSYPARINDSYQKWNIWQGQGRQLRERNNLIKRHLSKPLTDHSSLNDEEKTLLRMSKEEAIEEARILKERLSGIKDAEAGIEEEVQEMAVSIPNLTSNETPRGSEGKVLGYINDHPEPNPNSSDRVWRSHVHIGSELNLLDFAGAATTSGWGWYYLLNEAAELEQALVQYAFSVAKRKGWGMVIPPSMVYSHIAAACGFQPRDLDGNATQIYNIRQNPEDISKKPEYSLAGTAEIPLAGMKASTMLAEEDLPIKNVGVSRCYRAEAGARGVDTKGLYRVHEFTKVEMFAWTMPSPKLSTKIFNEMVSIQTEVLQSLGLHCRILEMPSTDLGASAFRKIDIEAFFPSRREKDDGWGEVTSVSECTDYQTRRLDTRVKTRAKGGKIEFPYTVNGTALAVPRVLAAILENGWDEEKMLVRIPECLWPWMDGRRVIEKKERLQ